MKTIKFLTQSAKAGHLVEELTITDALAKVKAEVKRGRWCYGTTADQEMVRIEPENFSEADMQTFEQILSTPNLEGGSK